MWGVGGGICPKDFVAYYKQHAQCNYVKRRPAGLIWTVRILMGT
jgi:hypothetical protein